MQDDTGSTMSLAAGTPTGDARRREEFRGAFVGLDAASVMGVELMAATLTWSGIGWLVDRWLGTPPWFLAIGALLGNAAGIYLIWLRSGRMQDAAIADREAGPPVAQ
ncbi:MAG: AtpZ/AtpI family protein [Nitriliruptor sp.]|uniref:AtpZ/AtpI family protein n=1 Tax=Nitriliruptor sp. TaxID=2448056 RepID=UPI0034A003AC